MLQSNFNCCVITYSSPSSRDISVEGKIKRGRRGKDNPNPGPGRSWEEWIQKLTSYREEHGDCRVPKAWAPDPSLANWVRNKRMHRKKGILSEGEIAQLDDLGFDWAREFPALSILANNSSSISYIFGCYHSL